jgi:hypothetical protein
VEDFELEDETAKEDPDTLVMRYRRSAGVENTE